MQPTSVFLVYTSIFGIQPQWTILAGSSLLQSSPTIEIYTHEQEVQPTSNQRSHIETHPSTYIKVSSWDVKVKILTMTERLGCLCETRWVEHARGEN